MQFVLKEEDYPKLYHLANKQRDYNNEFFAYLQVKYGYDRVYKKMNISRRDYYYTKCICEATEKIELLLRNIKSGITAYIDEKEFRELFEPNIEAMQNWNEKIH